MIVTEEDKFVHAYDVDASFQADYNGDVYHEPWVSLTRGNRKVNYNKKREYTINITFSNRAVSGDVTTITSTATEGTPASFRMKSAPAEWGEHEFKGWSTVEWPTYEQYLEPGFIKQSGEIAESEEDVTYYAVYFTTFQGLIDEGYVNMNVVPETYNIGVGNSMFVKPNGYAKEMVIDFQEVFDSNPDKLVSTAGVVGSGTSKNVFSFKDSTAHWLTSDEWYDIYNDTELNHAVASFQFYGMDWSDKDNITIKYNGNNWQVGTSTFGPKSPRVINIHFASGQFGYMFKTYGNSAIGCGAEIINFSRASGAKVGLSRPAQADGGVHAAFEGCRNLKEIHNINFAPVTYWNYAFDGCHSLEVIPASDFATGLTIADAMLQMFCNNYKLERIEPILNVSAATLVDSAFNACTSLTEFYLLGVNAAKNVNNGGSTFPQPLEYTWDLHVTKMTQACADYLITNMIPFDPASVQDYTYKGINFPSTVSLTNAQITALETNGWYAYINNVRQTA